MKGRLLLLAGVLAVTPLLWGAGAASNGSQPWPANVHAVTAGPLQPAFRKSGIAEWRFRSRDKQTGATRTPASASATWCGTATSKDVAPNVVAGHPVHWIYAIPSDAPDRFSSFANLMQTDVEAIDAWWRREDPTRTLRSDLRQLSCGAQVDVTSLRFPQPGSALDQEFDFGDIFANLGNAGFTSEFTKYVVYYDGPVAEPGLCGLGGNLGGIGLAVVYVRACAGEATASTAAHELLHTLGAVPDAAPNNCPPPFDGHTCIPGDPEEPNDDLMWWTGGNYTFEQQRLDPGRDDYYGHSSAFTDTQNASWLVRLDQQVPFRLNVTGPGIVTSDVPGLRCSQTCTTTWNSDTLLNLSATPSSSAKLIRWSGGNCSGTFGCQVSVTPGRTIDVLFAPRVFKLTVGVAGRGSVRTSGGRIACRPRCSASVASYVPVRLTATPSKGWKLRAWKGACRGAKRTCTVPMSKAATARAVFVRA